MSSGRHYPSGSWSLFVRSPHGLESLVARELGDLGFSRARIEPGGVAFRGGITDVYHVNLHSRMASRVLVRVARFHASEFHELVRNTKRVQWSDYAAPGGRISLRVTCQKSRLYHSQAVAARITDVVSVATGAECAGSIIKDDIVAGASQSVFVDIRNNVCTISVDSSGAHLHLRGYRTSTGNARIRETLAAAMLEASSWNLREPLVNPYCALGAVAIEAALAARHVAPGIAAADRSPREFAFAHWPCHDGAAWDRALEAARAQMIAPSALRIFAYDRDARSVAATRANAELAGVAGDLQVARCPMTEIRPPAERGVVACSPPYDKRRSDAAELRGRYSRFGEVLRTRFSNWEVALLSANFMLERELGLQMQSVVRTDNGGIPVRILSTAAMRT